MNGSNMKLMAQQDKYILRIPRDKSGLLIFGVGVGFIALRTIVPFLYGIQVLFILYMGPRAIRNRNGLFSNRYVIAYLLFLIWCLCSVFWSPSASRAINTTISVGQMIVIGTFMTLYFDELKNIDKVLYGFAIASIVMLVFLFIKTPFSEWSYALNGSFSTSTDEGRIGYSIGYHPNAMGNLCAMLVFVWLYLYDKTKKKTYLIWILIISIVLLFTKSRASMLVLFLEFFGYLLLCKKRNFAILKMIPTALILIVISYLAFFKVPILYEIVGFRLEPLLGVFNASSTMDASTYTRLNMIRYGLDMFRQHPISGVGFGNYGYYAYRYYGLFAETYAHSNYIELLADLGIVGVTLYYFIPVYSCITLGRCLRRITGDERKLCAFLFVSIAVRIITDTVKITYDDEMAQMLNVMCYCGAQLYYARLKEQQGEAVYEDFRSSE